MAHKKGSFSSKISRNLDNSKQKSITATVTKYVCNHFDRYIVVHRHNSQFSTVPVWFPLRLNLYLNSTFSNWSPSFWTKIGKSKGYLITAATTTTTWLADNITVLGSSCLRGPFLVSLKFNLGESHCITADTAKLLAPGEEDPSPGWNNTQ